MSTKMKLARVLSIIVASVIGLISQAWAQASCPRCQGCNVAPIVSNGFSGPARPSGTGQFPPVPVPTFDVNLGLLTGVRVTVTAEALNRKFTAENTNPISGCPGGDVSNPATLDVVVDVKDPANVTTILHADPFVNPAWHVDDVFPPLGTFDCCLDYGICNNDPGPGTPFQCCPGCPTPIGTGPIIPPNCPSQAPPPCTNPTAQASGYHRTFANASESITTACITTNLAAFLSSSGPFVNFPVTATAPENTGSSLCGGSIDKHWNSQVKVTVRVSYTYCPNPTASPDKALVCPATTQCPSSVDVDVLTNDCFCSAPVNCSTLTATNGLKGTTQIVGCSGNGTSTGCPHASNPCGSCVIRYTPNIGATGTDTFTYTVKDTNNLMTSSTVYISICNPPLAKDDPPATNPVTPDILTCIDVPVVFDVLDNDRPGAATAFPAPFLNCPSNPIVCTSLQFVNAGGVAQIGNGPFLTTKGSVQINQSCTGVPASSPGAPCPATTTCIKYTPNAGACGADTFKYLIKDSAGCCSLATVKILIVPPPVALPDTAMLCEQPLAQTPPCTEVGQSSVSINVFGNDSVPQTCGGSPTPGGIDCASMMILSSPSKGSLQPQACPPGTLPCPNACLVYTPNPQCRGVDTFTYKFTDNRKVNDPAFPNSVHQSTGGIPCQSNTATVTVTIKCAPDAKDDSYSLNLTQQNPMAILDVLLNDDAARIGDGIPPCDENAACAGTTLPHDSAHIALFPPGTTSTPNATLEVQADGTIKYTQTHFPLPPEGDAFCYKITNSNGCTDIARVTITPPSGDCDRNRRQCASLLLYPEFNNSQQALTLVTITMGCCEPPTGSTKVEFRFINKANCLEANTTYTLTPCDTITFLTSYVNPNMSQGYLYAYAKNSTPTPNNPTGTPIVFNHLIGNELIIDGIQALDYGMNAVAFKAYGTNGDDVADNTPNDDDGDGIRDLNGKDSGAPEYDEAPDKICIPRFFGQDFPGGNTFANSLIILINLSGGRAFTTTVSIDGFNDNEEHFSGQYTFYCWAKPYLRDFSAATLQSYLLGTNHNPNEVFGLNEETGWLTLDGLVANSVGPESIDDPAIYAVLVEELQGHWAADLPWECCSQTNGALLPTSIFGDGDPNSVPGDDQ